jgi:hypothetical protein
LFQKDHANQLNQPNILEHTLTSKHQLQVVGQLLLPYKEIKLLLRLPPVVEHMQTHSTQELSISIIPKMQHQQPLQTLVMFGEDLVKD